MNLDQVKTGDRLWVMLPGQNWAYRVDYDPNDLITHMIPVEVTYFSRCKNPNEDEDDGILCAECQAPNGTIFRFHPRKIHQARDEAIRQAMKVIDCKIKALREGYERYNEMLGKSPA